MDIYTHLQYWKIHENRKYIKKREKEINDPVTIIK